MQGYLQVDKHSAIQFSGCDRALCKCSRGVIDFEWMLTRNLALTSEIISMSNDAPSISVAVKSLYDSLCKTSTIRRPLSAIAALLQYS